MRKNELFLFDLNLRKKYKEILGIDEVGRGCVGGPLVVAGVILKKDFFNDKIKDSKKIKNINTRKLLADLIINNSIEYHYVIFNNKEVDKLNPKLCSKLGMEQVVNKFKHLFDIVITDYEKININKEQINLKHGDNTSFTVACASIIAKHIRDTQIEKLNNLYPEYDLIHNQGYLTQKHLNLIKRHGINFDIHRTSYKPISKLINKSKE